MSKIKYDSLFIAAKMFEKNIEKHTEIEDNIIKELHVDYYNSDDVYDYYKNYRIAHLEWITRKELLDFRDNIFRKNNPDFDYDENFVKFILDTSPIECKIYDGSIIIADFQTILACAIKEWLWLLYTKVLAMKNNFNTKIFQLL